MTELSRWHFYAVFLSTTLSPLSADDAVAREVLGHHRKLQQHLSRGLRLQAVAVCLRCHEFFLFEAWATAKEEGCA